LGCAAFILRAEGRLQEARQPMKACLDGVIQQNDWENSAINAGNLSELMLTLGEVEKAVDYARQSVTYADRSGDDYQRESDRTTLADALHQSGQLDEAEELFKAAEAMQKNRLPNYPFLCSLWGFRYCDFLLGQGKYQEVMERVEQTLELTGKRGDLLSNALDKLSLGRAWMMKNQKEESVDFKKAKDFLNQAVDGLREAGQQQYIAPSLLARAAFYRWQKQFSNAWDDLKEAKEIAELGSMKLYLVDYHLEAGRLCEAERKIEEAERHFEIAAKMIEETGYHRRDKEVKKVSRQ
jgi:tetratricopeptide (TPR) repeat protein